MCADQLNAAALCTVSRTFVWALPAGAPTSAAPTTSSAPSSGGGGGGGGGDEAHQIYTLEQLKALPLPAGVDPAKREVRACVRLVLSLLLLLLLLSLSLLGLLLLAGM